MNLELNEAERLTLQELSIHHRYADFRLRALSVLALAKGHPLPVVADILGVTPQIVYHWLKAWRTRGLMGCWMAIKAAPRPSSRPPCRDTAEAIARTAPATLAEIARQVHAAHPEAPDFSLDRLSAGLRARGSRSHAHAVLKKSRCPVRFEAARVNLKHGQEAARAGKIGLFYLDESGFCTIPNVQRAWNPKGKPAHGRCRPHAPTGQCRGRLGLCHGGSLA